MRINTAKLADGYMVKGGSALRKEGNEFYSYATRVAFEHETMPVLYVNPTKYSRTTSKQMTWLKRYYREQGFSIVNWDTGEAVTK